MEFVYSLNIIKENEMKTNNETNKRFRDVNGKLTMSTAELAIKTKEEAEKYYKDGKHYLYQGETYQLIKSGTEAHLLSCTGGKEIVLDTDMLGTFLPDVASDGPEIIAVTLPH